MRQSRSPAHFAALVLLGGLLALSPRCAAETVPPGMLTAAEPPEGAIWLDSLDLRFVQCGWQQAQAGRSVEENPLRLAGVTYPHGVGTHARSQMVVDLQGVVTRFVAMVGVDDEKTGLGTIVFRVLVDGVEKLTTPTLTGGAAPVLIDLDLTGARRLALLVDDADDDITHDHADWAGALLFLQPGATARPAIVDEPAEPPLPDVMPWPLAPTNLPAPRLHGPTVVGTTPGRPFLFRIPASGQGPLRYAATGLPAGLTLDPDEGLIRGAVETAGETEVELHVTGPRGEASGRLRIIAGPHKLAQTPPLGWNSWNVYAAQVDDARIRATADAMVVSGLAAHGYQYINIDDHWEGQRNAAGDLLTDPDKFPDMKALADYVHGKGLKLGIYSSPGPRTCGQREGSYQHEQQDARQWAAWGIDYLKYDWCSYGEVATGEGLERLQKPYRVMREALDAVDRDIVYSLCQYGMGQVWEWGEALGANCWRTTGDITDTWDSMSRIGFGGFGRAAFAGPGHWNDPDMMVVGKVGWGKPRANRLTQMEQLTHFTLWCLQASPILLGCDLTDLDDFTLAMLTNAGALAIHQDPLGRAAERVSKEGVLEVWARPLADGSTAVGLFNRGREPATVTCRWETLGVVGSPRVLDIWQGQELGNLPEAVVAEVAPHGCRLLQVGP